MPDITGSLLLIEDCGEALYRLDRIMNHLKLAEILPRLGAILLGEFTGCAENNDICMMVMDHVREFDFPVVHSLPFGHGLRNEVIAFGPHFLLDTHERLLKILEAPVAR
jgi:muramoyltetrapeptide carboxypeptidase